MNKYPVITRVMKGSCAKNNQVPEIYDAVISIPGENQRRSQSFGMNREMLHRGTLTVGGTGSGKTTLMRKISSQLRQETSDYSMIVLEVKKDYQEELFYQGDLYLGMGNAGSQSVRPNLFQDILIDGWDETEIKLNCMEISRQLFADLKNQSQQFFPDAAQILLYEVMVLYINEARHSLSARKKLSNKGLVNYFSHFSEDDYAVLLKKSEDPGVIRWLLGHDGKNNQALGVLGQVVLIVLNTFVDVFGAEGEFSIRRFVREKNNRCLFLQYDPAFKETQQRIFGVLLTLMFKEILSRNTSKGKVIFICDELPAIGKTDLSEVINLGRAKGFICLAGIQSVAQLYQIYSESEANTMLAGFGTKICFQVFDSESRKFIKETFGENLVEEIRLSPGGNLTERRKGYVVEDEMISELRTGDCVVGLVGYEPFLFHVGQ